MKKSYFIIPLYVLALVCCVGCSTESGVKNMPVVAQKTDNLTVCDVNSLNETIEIPLSTLTEELQIVKLENSEQALVGQTSVEISANFLLVKRDRTLPFKLFERKTGKFVCNIGSIGQGPGEYMLVYHQQLDEANNRIYLLPWQAKNILVFDLQGNIYPPIPICFSVPKGIFNVNTQNSTVTVATLPFTGAEAVVWTQTTDGRLLSSVAPGPLELRPDFSNEVEAATCADDFAFSIYTFVPRIDTLYHYESKTNQLKPVFTLDFKNREAVIHSYTELPGYYMGSILKEVQINPQTFISEEVHSYIVNKKNMQGGYFKLINDFLGGTEINYPSVYFRGGYYIRNVEPGVLLTELEKVLEEKKDLPSSVVKKLSDLKSSISDDDNNYILYAKLK